MQLGLHTRQLNFIWETFANTFKHVFYDSITSILEKISFSSVRNVSKAVGYIIFNSFI